MQTRNNMHTKSEKTVEVKKTDSQKMFEMGIEGGKPPLGKRGVQPEWFFKGKNQ